MIKAIIFDCFGVLAVDGWLPFKDEHFGDSPDMYAAATMLNKKSDSGLSSYDDFVRDVAKLANISEKETRKAIEHNPANKPLFTYISDELKPKYKIGLLSNAAANWLSEIFTPEQVGLFDAVALSYDQGFIKPDPRSYQTIAEQLSFEPNECVFIDDQQRYCTGAEEVGMKAIQYQSFEQCKKELEAILAS